MVHTGLAVHRTIVVVDVESFGDRRRNNANQVAVRDGLYRSLQSAFSVANIPWQQCEHEDRGDGVFVLVSSEVPKAPFVEVLPQALVKALSRHNIAHPAEERIRLRMSLHAGEVNYDQHGITAASINHAFRLLDAAPLKKALADSQGVLAVIVSEWFFDEVVRHSPVEDVNNYRRTEVAVKETVAPAWIFLPDPYGLTQDGLVDPQPAPAAPAGGPGVVVGDSQPAKAGVGPAPFADRQRIADLERENRELRWANHILKAAAGLFARELDPRPRSPLT